MLQWQKLPLLIFGMTFLGSAVIGRPLIFALARATLARESRQSLKLLNTLSHHPHVRRTMTVMTLVWGNVLLVQFSICCVFLERMSPVAFNTLSTLLGYAFMTGLFIWIMLYRRCRVRLLDDSVKVSASQKA